MPIKLRGVNMNIPKAIEILTDMSIGDNVASGEDCEMAMNLGIEALKRVKGNRLYPQPTVYPLLPGETED